MLSRRTFAGLLAGAILFATPAVAPAAEVTRVVSAADPDDPFDFNVSLSWLHEEKSARLVRETEGATNGGIIGTANDLTYNQVRNTLALRADVGVLPDIGFSIIAPFVLSDDRSLGFDTGVTAANSSLLRDGFLPGFGQNTYGIDAQHDGRPFTNPDTTVFRGPTRRGLEYLGFALSWAAMNQERDKADPTWILRFEPRFALGENQRFDPANPGGNTSVGLGYHQLFFSTAFSRRFRRLEPYMVGWYMLPLAKDSSPYSDHTYGANAFSRPQHQAGVSVGVEGLAWEKPEQEQRIVIELRGRYEARFLGLAQGPLWEALSGPSTCATDQTTCRPGLDLDLNGDGKKDPNPGITRSPSYGVLGGDLGINVQAGPHVRFHGLFGLMYEQAHDLTDGRSGNPVYDIPGRRFRIEDSVTWSVLVDGALLF